MSVEVQEVDAHESIKSYERDLDESSVPEGSSSDKRNESVSGCNSEQESFNKKKRNVKRKKDAKSVQELADKNYSDVSRTGRKEDYEEDKLNEKDESIEGRTPPNSAGDITSEGPDIVSLVNQCGLSSDSKKERMKKSKKKRVSKSKNLNFQTEDYEDEAPAEVSSSPGKRRRKASPRKSHGKKSKGGGKGKRKRSYSTDSEEEESDNNYEVGKILDVRYLKSGKREFLIQWKGFSSEYDTWEPEANLNCKDLIKDFFERNEKETDDKGTGKDEIEAKRRASSRAAHDSSTQRTRTCKGGSRNEKDSENIELLDKRATRSITTRLPRRGDSLKERGSGNGVKPVKEVESGRNSRRSQNSTSAGSDSELSESRDSEDSDEQTIRKTKDTKRKTPRQVSLKDRKRRKLPEGESVEPVKGEEGWHKKNKKEQNKKNVKNSRMSSEVNLEDSGIDDSVEYEVERIVDVRYLKSGNREFLIKWKGFTSKDNSWEPENNLNCSEKLNKFLQDLDKLKSPMRELRFERKKTDRFTLESQRHQRKLSTRIERLPRKSYSEID